MKPSNRMPLFRERLNNLMEGRSTTEFAKFVGLSRQTVGFYLNGDRIPDCETLAQICTKCNVSANWLLGLSNTKSLEANVETVIQYTGLTEENVQFIHKQKTVVDEKQNPNVYIYEHSILTYINDLIELCQSGDAHLRFYQMYRLWSSYKNRKARADEGLEWMAAEGAAEQWGYAVLTVNDSIEFYSSQLSRAIEQAIVNKYSVSQTSEPSGRCETVEVNGRKVKFWKE